MKVFKVEVTVNKCVPKTGEIAPIHIGFLVYPGFQPIDLSGPWQAFSTANEELGQPLYLLATYGPSTDVRTSDGGLRILVEHSLETLIPQRLHTVIVPGGYGVYHAAQDSNIQYWLKSQDLSSVRTCSVCTGAFLLASAGLLEGHLVTTHWRAAEQLRQAFPSLDVADERIFCESGKYWTTAGVTAGIDLALALIERDCGPLISQRVARRLLVYLRRHGDQRQYSQTLRMQDRAGMPFHELIEQIEKNLAWLWSVDEMASVSHMSRRTFQRKFKKCFGISSVEALKALRLEKAQLLMAAGSMTKKEVARKVGLQLFDVPDK
ncbi:GlxA family transcriptional regulator [Halomonas sp. AOP13-D3-9]